MTDQDSATARGLKVLANAAAYRQLAQWADKTTTEVERRKLLGMAQGVVGWTNHLNIQAALDLGVTPTKAHALAQAVLEEKMRLQEAKEDGGSEVSFGGARSRMGGTPAAAAQPPPTGVCRRMLDGGIMGGCYCGAPLWEGADGLCGVCDAEPRLAAAEAEEQKHSARTQGRRAAKKATAAIALGLHQVVRRMVVRRLQPQPPGRSGRGSATQKYVLLEAAGTARQKLSVRPRVAVLREHFGGSLMEDEDHTDEE